MLIDLYDNSLLLIFLLSVAVILTANEIGRWLGRRSADQNQSGSDVLTLESALLGLLALMIAFTFAMALSRFEARRDAVLNEANAIGTASQRAHLLPAPYSTETQKLLREYVQIRLDITQRVSSPAELEVAIARSNQIHQALWQVAKAVAAKDNGLVPTGLFIQALGEMGDSQSKRLAALRNRVPVIVLLTLYGVATAAGLFTGYANGLGARPSRFPAYLTIVLVCVMLLLIQDLEKPGTGFFSVSQQPMLDTAAGIAASLE
jgi:hypothetical protein